jgi:putative effector of murein hydrolase LrgA (UPF0299 family)
VFGALSLIIAPEISTKYMSFLTIPAAIFCANYFLRIKQQWWGELLIIVLLGTILVNHFFY